MDTPNSSRPLPQFVEEVFETITPRVEATEDGFPREKAKSYLEKNGFEPSTIETALDQLLNRGYIYVVDGRIRLTDA